MHFLGSVPSYRLQLATFYLHDLPSVLKVETVLHLLHILFEEYVRQLGILPDIQVVRSVDISKLSLHVLQNDFYEYYLQFEIEPASHFLKSIVG